MKCPNCGKRDHIHRSHRKSRSERIFSLLIFHRPFRCHKCMTRFWRPVILPHKSKRARLRRRSRRDGRGRGHRRK